jgi:hypothetical protein
MKSRTRSQLYLAAAVALLVALAVPASALAAPTITELAPADGPPSGGTVVTITGSGFTGATAVMFGPNEAESFTVDSDSSITAVAPAGKGFAYVRVIGPSGESPWSFDVRFRYGPVVQKIEPWRGPAPGGTVVTIIGFGLDEVSEVNFGSEPASSFEENGDGSVTAVAPPFSGGSATVPVTVTTPVGVSTTCGCGSLLPQNYFRYGPTVTGIEPAEAPEAGGITVTIHGTGFVGERGSDELPFVESVDFGSTRLTCSTSWGYWEPCGAPTFEVVSGTEIMATAPPGSGTVDVIVETHGGASPANPADLFSYAPPAPLVAAAAASTSTASTAAPAAPGSPQKRRCRVKKQQQGKFRLGIQCRHAARLSARG